MAIPGGADRGRGRGSAVHGVDILGFAHQIVGKALLVVVTLQMLILSFGRGSLGLDSLASCRSRRLLLNRGLGQGSWLLWEVALRRRVVLESGNSSAGIAVITAIASAICTTGISGIHWLD